MKTCGWIQFIFASCYKQFLNFIAFNTDPTTHNPGVKKKNDAISDDAGQTIRNPLVALSGFSI